MAKRPVTALKEQPRDPRAEMATAVAKTTGPALVGGMIARLVWWRLLFALAVLGSIAGGAGIGVHFAGARKSRADAPAPAHKTAQVNDEVRLTEVRPPAEVRRTMGDFDARIREARAKQAAELRRRQDIFAMTQTWNSLSDQLLTHATTLPPLHVPSPEELMRLGDEQLRLEHWHAAAVDYFEAYDLAPKSKPRFQAIALITAADVLVDHFADEGKQIKSALSYYRKASQLVPEDAELRAQADKGAEHARATLDAVVIRDAPP
jgi:hypothetical protein